MSAPRSGAPTPGPWVWGEDGIMRGPDGVAIVETDMGVYGPRGADKPLIAAAPDLLTALRDLIMYEPVDLSARSCHANAVWSHGPRTGQAMTADECDRCGKVLRARAAIAKAEGKP